MNTEFWPEEGDSCNVIKQHIEKVCSLTEVFLIKFYKTVDFSIEVSSFILQL